MGTVWQQNVQRSYALIRQNRGAAVATVVSGSHSDQAYWREHLTGLRGDLFRSDQSTVVASVHERSRKGNFLGTLHGWCETQCLLDTQGQNPPPLAMMSMVFGQGKRFSPFTQALGNRKPAFLTPLKSSRGGHYLNTADVACATSALLYEHLQSHGFCGLLIKWGDEAIIPGKIWPTTGNQYRQVDAVRFVWLTEPNEELAREKDWILIDAASGLMKFQYSRQALDSLNERMNAWGDAQHRTGVNLGSLAISYPFLEVAQEVFGEDAASSDRWLDWDPYVWIALFCPTVAEWRSELAHEERLGRTGIREIEGRYPDFYVKVQAMRQGLEERMGRPLAIATLDFGQPYWMDWGLHISLRKTLESLTEDSDEGRTAREIFQLPQERDRNQNIILRSELPPQADIRNSVIIDTVITDPETVIHKGVVVAGRHRRLTMPHGGSALFCAGDHFSFTGAHGIAFRSVGGEVVVPTGGRHTTLYLAHGPATMVSNEAQINYDGLNYSQPIFQNPLSFEEANRLVAEEAVQALEARWFQHWDNWLR